jgi:hypothetical protein
MNKNMTGLLLECETPNEFLYKFQGTLVVEGEKTAPLGID